ncbi:alpha/beta hydrolase [Streptomyces sp. ICN988]|uniref:alpha/beta fold hydrolase n=1 Tax=Streptomyces sp. ICN988 TaxID=2983765 RepID=UPI0021E4D38D|nr:alpha/beta hydrolase [Streptomyces sp. ICN988]MCV2462936.1 alpha/beta hydrolase [Streptomyces sp. ICN988]
MAWAAVNGIRMHYDSEGTGQPVVMVMGSGSRGRVWDLHQVPALTAAGFRVITFDNRGIPPTEECAEGFTVEDMVADTAALVEHLGLGPCLFVGTSMGAQIVQELALARPELVRRAVLMATRGRSDTMRRALAGAEIALHDSGLRLPPAYTAVMRALQNLSPRTLADPARISDWLDLFEMSAPTGRGDRVHMEFSAMDDRLAAYAEIGAPCHVISFADDLITPAHLGREVADAIPGATYDLVPDCGHYGYLEEPDAVNKIITEFLRQEG